MKLLFVAPLKDFSGFAEASRRLLQALQYSDKIDVVARALQYDQLDPGQSFVCSTSLNEALNKNIQGVDMCLQMTTANIEAQPVPGIINGLYSFFETDRLQPAWASKAQQFDFLMVASRYNAETLVRSGVTRPILIVAPPCDKKVYEKSYQPFQIQNSDNRTIFYNICQLSTKKGIALLLRAYYAAFASMPNDVLLVLKTYVNMQDRSRDMEVVKQYIASIKQRTRIPVHTWPPVLPLVNMLTSDEIHSLHKRGDAYVCASRSEGYNVPLVDAMCHGNTVISHAATAMGDYVSKDNALVYGGSMSLYFDSPHPDPGLYTGIEQCYEPSVAELALVMQRFHLLRKGAMEGSLEDNHMQEWDAVLQRRQNASLMASRFNYTNTSQPIVQQLLSVYNSWKLTGVARFEENK